METSKLLFLTFVCVIALSCRQNKVSDITIAKKSPDIVQVVDQVILDSLSFSSDRKDILFIVNASCSLCISQFLDEVSLIKNFNGSDMEINGTKYVILPEGTAPLIRHYISRQSDFPMSDFNFIELSSKYNVMLCEYSGYFYVYDKGIITGMWTPEYH